MQFLHVILNTGLDIFRACIYVFKWLRHILEGVEQ